MGIRHLRTYLCPVSMNPKRVYAYMRIVKNIFRPELDFTARKPILGAGGWQLAVGLPKGGEKRMNDRSVCALREEDMQRPSMKS